MYVCDGHDIFRCELESAFVFTLFVVYILKHETQVFTEVWNACNLVIYSTRYYMTVINPQSGIKQLMEMKPSVKNQPYSKIQDLEWTILRDLL